MRFWCLLCLFISFVLPFGIPCDFFFCCWKLNILHWVMETDVSRPLVWGFMLVWQGVELYLVFAITVGVEGLKFLEDPCLNLSLLTSGFPKSSERVYMATLSNLIHYYLYWKPCLYGDKGGEMFIIFQLNLSLWVELCLWPVTFLHSYPQCQLGERKAHGGCKEKTLPSSCWRKALVKSFLLNSKPLLWKGFWVFHKDYSSVLSARTKKGSSWSLIMTVWWSSWSEWNPMKPCVAPSTVVSKEFLTFTLSLQLLVRIII